MNSALYDHNTNIKKISGKAYLIFFLIAKKAQPYNSAHPVVVNPSATQIKIKIYMKQYFNRCYSI
jgi:hypothetical protein